MATLRSPTPLIELSTDEESRPAPPVAALSSRAASSVALVDDDDSQSDRASSLPGDVDALTNILSALHVSPSRDPPAIYAVQDGSNRTITTHWFHAGSQQHEEGAHVVRLTPKRRVRTRKAQAYVVYCGRRPGVYTNYDDVEEAVTNERSVLWQSYASRQIASEAFEYARTRPGIVYDTSVVQAQRTFNAVRLPQPELQVFSAITPLSAGSSTKWHVVYTGTRPGVYSTYIEAAIHYVGIPGAIYNSYATYEHACSQYLLAPPFDISKSHNEHGELGKRSLYTTYIRTIIALQLFISLMVRKKIHKTPEDRRRARAQYDQKYYNKNKALILDKKHLKYHNAEASEVGQQPSASSTKCVSPQAPRRSELSTLKSRLEGLRLRLLRDVDGSLYEYGERIYATILDKDHDADKYIDVLKTRMITLRAEGYAICLQIAKLVGQESEDWRNAMTDLRRFTQVVDIVSDFSDKVTEDPLLLIIDVVHDKRQFLYQSL
ncbi:hypothetical protein BDZ89DRAFT_1141223 [Hymenopellis radicata]|nr:hypothetical protein BDZ89DRAFT_1141223 [Hymenopellis radicata]